MTYVATMNNKSISMHLELLPWRNFVLLTFSPLDIHTTQIENQKLSIISLNIAPGCQLPDSQEQQPQDLFNVGFAVKIFSG